MPEMTMPRKAVAEQLEEFVDRLRDRVVRLFLGENERVGHLEHREREGQQATGDEVGEDERQRDLEHRLERRAAEVLRGLLERLAGLLETGRRRADDVGKAANRVGDDQQ